MQRRMRKNGGMRKGLVRLSGRIYNIEVREAGVWKTVDYADSLEDALLLASSLCQTVREEWIRISTLGNTVV